MKKFLVMALIISTTAFGANVKVFGGGNFSQDISDEDGSSDSKYLTTYTFGAEFHTQVGDMIEIGAGIKKSTPLVAENSGVEMEMFSTMPIYLSGKLNFGDTPKFYVQGVVGYSLNTVGKDFKNNNLKVDSGVFYGAGIGMDLGALSIGLNYDVHNSAISDSSGKSDITYTAIGATVGYKIGE